MNQFNDSDPGNVVRFPSELLVLPSLVLIGALEPDLRDVMLVADSLGLDVPAPDLCDRVDEETARYLAEQVLPLTASERRRALDGLLRPVLLAAVDACRSAALAVRRSAGAAGDVRQARAEGGQWLAPVEGIAAALLHEAGCAVIEAHCRCCEARGVGRAVGMAHRGEAWVPRDPAGLWAWGTEEGAAAREA